MERATKRVRIPRFATGLPVLAAALLMTAGAGDDPILLESMLQ